MLKLLLLGFTLALTTLSLSSHAEKVMVKVGGYLFPPFVQMKGQNITGLTPDLINLFNQQQDEFEFIFTPTSPKRRYSDFSRGLFDVIFFENKAWSWQDLPVDESDVFLSGGEVFFTKQLQGRDQTYFNNIKDKSISAILGYHYNFLNNQTHAPTLKKQFNIKLVNSPKTVINQVISEKSQIGIATYSYLQQEIKNNPSLSTQIIISNFFDQTYQHQILVRQDHLLTVKKINALINKIKHNGTLLKLLANYGLTPLK